MWKGGRIVTRKNGATKEVITGKEMRINGSKDEKRREKQRYRKGRRKIRITGMEGGNIKEMDAKKI